MNDHIARLLGGGFQRYAWSVIVGLAVTLLLFLLMQRLIESDRSPHSEPPKGQLLSFVRLLEEPPVVFRPPHIILSEVEPPPRTDPPTLPPGEVCQGTGCGVGIGPPPLEPPPVAGTRVATDGEYLPIVKVAPFYPRRAASRNIQGYVLLEFTVTAMGSVRDPVVVEASPPGVFDRAAIAAALKFKYKPKVLNGRAMDVRGVRNLIRFELDDG